jgi:hypothetical protein
MAKLRTELQEVFEGLFDSDPHVYFQPPTNIQMQYPCIIYRRDNSRNEYAGNKRYLHTKRYQVTVVDRNPDTELPDKVEELPLCSIDRTYSTEGLNHYVFTLFF